MDPCLDMSIRDLPQVARLIRQRDLFEKEIHVARDAANITARLVVEQFSRMDKILAELEEKSRIEIELRKDLQQKLNEVMQREKELEKAREEAMSATRAKSSFLASMSHEIRTPMNAIIGMTNLMQSTPMNKEQADFISIIRESGSALLTIINDILDFSKIESGSLELEYHPFDLRKCVYSALNQVSIQADSKGLELCAMIEAHTPVAVVGDVTRLRQVLVNLLNNAVKFTDQGEIVLYVNPIEKRQTDRETAFFTIEIKVQDTGIGIDEKGKKRLFKSFSQVDASTTRMYGGTGLGLAICKQLVNLMGGDIRVESTPAKGSQFIFTIKVEEAQIEKPVYMADEQPQLEKRKVLGVDDNKTNRLILRRQLEAWGMTPTVVASGQEALDLLDGGQRFDFAVLDMHMPHMDGVMLATEIKKRPEYKNMPLIMLSSMGSMGSSMADGLFEAFHSKPIEPSQLYNSFLHVLGYELDFTREGDIFSLDRKISRDHPLTILLAEDNLNNQKMAITLLERMGYHADIAANGLEAVSAAKSGSYDVILMDVQMPEMDGLQATRRIRSELPPQKQPCIVAVTANAMVEDRKACIEAGMDEYITKPIMVDKLHAALMSCTPVKAGGDRKAPEPPPPVSAVIPSSAPDKVSFSDDVQMLLADDNGINRLVLRGYLKKLGLTADMAENGLEAVKALSKKSYDLVFMDVQMPEMDGFTATGEIRDPVSSVLDHQIPVIAMTANAMAGDREKCLEAGMNDYLSKPVNPKKLLEMLLKWLPPQKINQGAAVQADTSQDTQNPSPVPALKPDTWNMQGMMKRLMGDAHLAEKIMTAFIRDMPGQISALEASIGAGNPRASQSGAWAIASAAGNVGGDALQKTAWQIERLCGAGTFSSSASVLESKLYELKTLFNGLSDDIRQHIGELQ